VQRSEPSGLFVLVEMVLFDDKHENENEHFLLVDLLVYRHWSTQE
jgi:hypothetical protein